MFPCSAQVAQCSPPPPSSVPVEFTLESSRFLQSDLNFESLQPGQEKSRGSDGGRRQAAVNGDELWPVLVRVLLLVVLHVLR